MGEGQVQHSSKKWVFVFHLFQDVLIYYTFALSFSEQLILYFLEALHDMSQILILKH